MMKESFSLPTGLPKHVPEISLYRVTKYLTLSPRVADVKTDFDARAERLKGLFKIGGSAKDLGTQVLFQDGAKSLEVYRPSDSFWWSDSEVAYREKVPAGAMLPDDKTATDTALRYLKQLNLDPKHATVERVARSSCAMTEGAKEPIACDTEVHVIFAYALGGHPVFGPGAKIKVSMVEDGRISNLIWFWREIVDSKPVKTIPPESALAKFSEHPRFASITDPKARVNVESAKFGHYALPPFEFQRFLIPVYEVRGKETNALFTDREFRTYVPAMEMTDETMKAAGFTAQADLTRLLPSSK